jgi:hypothetical protein
LIGWVLIFEGVFAWLANPCLLVSWISMIVRPIPYEGIVGSVLALALTLSFLLQKQVTTNSAGDVSKITGYGAGYWLWVASAAVACLGCFVSLMGQWMRPRSSE